MKKGKKNRIHFKWLILVLAIPIIFFLGLYTSIYWGVFGKIPTQKELANLTQVEASQLYGEKGKLIGKYFITDREAISFTDLPENLIHALIATEDVRFYEHKGIDQRSLMRVFFKTLLQGKRSSGGGSTLTLQLAKNLYGRQHYPVLGVVINKLKESFVAQRLEKVYTKDEILTLYLNTVPFSGDTYGVESAAQKYFNSKTKDLSLSQSATLVGTLKANHSYDPRLFPERSQLRRDVVLQQMHKYGYLSESEFKKQVREPLEIDYRTFSSGKGLAPYFRERIRKEVLSLLQDKKYRKPDGSSYDLLRDGLKIYTTLDADLQKYAEQAMESHLAKLQNQFEKAYGNRGPWRKGSAIFEKEVRKLPVYKRLSNRGWSGEQIKDSLSIPENRVLFSWADDEIQEVSLLDSLAHHLKFLNTGLLSMDPKTGAVRAYVGGIDYQFSQFDHVYQSKRQVGSIFKPILYAAALENGIGACDYFPVHEVTYSDHKDWTPKNAGPAIDPELNYSVAASLVASLNTIPVKIIREVGITPTIDQAKKMGIKEKLENEPSIALGTSSIPLEEMAVAYTAFLNGGIPQEAFLIKKITTKAGEVIYAHDEKKEASPAFSETTRQTMVEILKKVVDEGTANRLRGTYGFQNDLAGKTGTTQGNTDGWFVGLLPDLVTVVWVGNDNPAIKFTSTALGQGANSALPIFAGFLQKINQDPAFAKLVQARFPLPPQSVLAAMDCEPTVKDGFFKRLFQKEEFNQHFERESPKEKRQRKREERREKRKDKNNIFKKIFGSKD